MLPVKAQDLQDRIAFQRQTQTRNQFGESMDVWRDIDSTDARVEQLSGRGEFFAALQMQSDATVKVTCLYSKSLSSITGKDRIKHGDIVYDIRHPPIRFGRRNMWMQFLCIHHVEA